LTGIIAAGYAANALFRAWLFWVGADAAPTEADMAPLIEELALPIYTVLVPLYREANIIPRLTASLRKLDYPLVRLDLKLVVEEDDNETVAAANVASADGFFEVIAVPAGEPRTKPRACNYALQFARGDMLCGDEPLQSFEDVLFKHPPEFMRRPGQKNNDCVAMLIVNMQELSRR
jgi:cellulose synthase/poly-beta-1,6-N-acetylglucosamine synthase-like glycosyltransferase